MANSGTTTGTETSAPTTTTDSAAVNDALIENAQGPLRVRVDGNEAEQHSLSDLIATDKHVANTATLDPQSGLPFIPYRAKPGGAV